MIGFLAKLEVLTFSKNGLSGIIPPGLGNITSLSGIDLSQNQLNGPIPSEFWHMPNIEELYLDENNLSGGIPQIISNLSSLQVLSLAYNMLGSTLPPNIGNALPSITNLYLGMNMFEGPIPASLGNASGLKELDLSSNKFTGQIPSIFRKLPSLFTLNLEQNMLEASYSDGWEFFQDLTNCRSLEVLSLSNNHLQGFIPSSIANLSTNLTKLVLGGNYLSGIVPSSIGNLSSLIQLSLDTNNLTGTIEEWIGKLIKLQRLNLQENSFTGTIPPSIINLAQLTFLSFAENKFTGLIPPSMGNQLQQISMLNLSYNNFQGSIPVEFGNLKQLTILDLSSNKLSGEIPETLGECQQLFTVQVGRNILTGNIPTNFSKLYSLSILNVSHNNLFGTLPTCLDNLKLLKLDLSYNNFQGEIPTNGVFNNATVSSLDGNPGLCGGVMDFHVPACHFVPRRVETINYLVKTLFPMFGFMSFMMLIYIIIHGKKTPRRPYLSFSFGKKFPKVSYKDLAQATGNFSKSNLIGRGSYGSVYEGKLTQAKMQVAIKVFDLEMRCANRSFISECEVLRSIRHRNLLPILTACSTIDNSGNDFKALIYVFMHNGNLDKWLHHKPHLAPKHLGLIQRMNVAISIADALAYLHYDCGRPIIHCDLKPTNILLDDDMNAHLGDFGIANLVLDSGSMAVGHLGVNSSVAATGTIGYIAPEYGQCVHASTCGDVYSFGIVLLEMLIGKRPTDSMFGDDLSIVTFVERNFPDQLLGKIDAHLQEECKGSIQAMPGAEKEVYQCLLSLVQVALSCTCLFPRERMNMREVAINLHAIRRSYVTAIMQE
ncbi:unnamed protein product [Urochloa decumbens]|uniref:Receptor kinase-like protein Xa21 n=1 Tax=Urochloa decumbens TaxID=240449 RepID=A0ABC8ZX33_9POAL